jgi:hypothetical protein
MPLGAGIGAGVALEIGKDTVAALILELANRRLKKGLILHHPILASDAGGPALFRLRRGLVLRAAR